MFCGGEPRLHRAAKSRPYAFGLRASLPPRAAGRRISCFGGARKRNQRICKTRCRTKKEEQRESNGNHQGATQTTKISDGPGSENAARSICKVHRLHSVLHHYRGSESLIQ